VPQTNTWQHVGPLAADVTSSGDQQRSSGTFATSQAHCNSGTSSTGQRHELQKQMSQEQTQLLSLPAPPPRYNKEVFELLGDSEHAIRERREIERQRRCEIKLQKRSEIERQRRKVDVHAYLENSSDKIDGPAHSGTSRCKRCFLLSDSHTQLELWHGTWSL